ncbi:molybdate ABC transporter permease subunit [Streptomyces alfalfae]|uniref:ABC transporter permease n=1 Tax=Streptomyces alfalfae TaxID=1642299 RepID=UPI000CD7E18E|nr:ABC transporter permease [Streptomyces alfalfae]AYA18878.1 molybdate ABC transporter permease subunit [Streptomyces fradiae]QUI31602.1 molybdate ABC transporter permease subunit [Streptomyces alfalfae]RXX47564.1 molybdate ABC transporter permease subunit [Streptomyces alfalfae]RZM92826.1 molybdate ABC transporter permease subunit [Streptomyces alfalfae]
MSRLSIRRPLGRSRDPARTRAPLALALPALLAIAFLLMPLIGILARTTWGDLGAHLSAPGVTRALKLSLLVSFWALGLSLLLGVPLAWLLARVDFPGKAVVRSLVLLPMVLPPTVGGVALLLGFGRRGLLGPWLEDTFGVVLPFHTSGAVIAATFVAMPFLVISLEGALGGLRPGYEETAASLGAPPVRVFLTVTLPMVTPGLIAGAALTWARALGEFGATITFAGNLPGTTQTLPLQVYLLLQDSPEAATSLSLLLLAIAMAVLIGLRGRWTTGAAVRVRPPRADEPPPAPADETPPPPAPAGKWSLHADVTGHDELTLDADPGTTIAVVGPNGAGKTTLLRALLGLTPRAHARLRLGERDVTALPPHRRRVAWVPQEGALFPHLSALGNTAYGLRAQGVRRAEARREAQRWLDRLGVGGLAHRRPAQLSGGQAQRVALARALAARPRLLLLDEPLAALDQTTRAHVRHTLRRHLDGFGGVCLIVTHDPVEAVSLADRVLVLDEGRTLQDAPPAEVTRHPRSPWVARMLGRNAWPGTAGADGTLALAGEGRLVVADPPAPGARALAVIAPEAVSVHRERPEGSPRNVWQGTVREITTAGSRLRVLVTSGEAPDLVAEITPQAAVELGLADGAEVWTSVKATEVSVVTL